jgi:type II secretory pathway pseudopilin PulG
VPTCPTSRPVRCREGERGFALILLFLLAAVVAISLYYEIPRVAMESQRAKEQLLIDRGEQYKRAIQLFYNKTKRYPAEIKDLESFQNTRFLRHRYIDPMTGKDEWRLIHVQNGVLTDSKVNKPQGQQGQNGTQLSTMGQFIGVQQGLGDQPTGGAGGGAATVRNRVRPSDGAVVNGSPGDAPPQQPGAFPATGTNAGMPPTGTIPGMQQYPGANPNGQPNVPGVATLPPGVPVPGNGNPNGYQVGVPGAPGGIPVGMPGSGNQPPGATGTQQTGSSGMFGGGSTFVGGGGSLFGSPSTNTNPGARTSGQQSIPGQPMPGQQLSGQPLPGQPGAPVNSQYNGMSPQPAPYSTNPGANFPQPGFPQPGGTTGAPNNQAADLIRNILTTPRPGGMPSNAGMGQTIGGGLAGVASTVDGEGVKVYNDRTNYSEWEFIFDLQKVKQIPNPNAQGAVGTPAGQLGNTQGMQQPGQPITPNNGFGPGLQTSPGTTSTFPRPGGQ